MKINLGTIFDFAGGNGGRAKLFVTRDGKSEIIFCDELATLQALHDAYGDVLGLTINKRPFVGKEIYYTTSNDNLLIGFMPKEDAPQEVVDWHTHQWGK